MRAALLLAMFLSPTVALAGDDAWPDSPNKLGLRIYSDPITTSALTRTNTRSHAVVQATW
jgi:hypothetical protein